MSLSPEILQQRYAAIELAYSERRWSDVESLSQALLQELPADPADPLRLRLVLLLGHTHLYGMGDAASAWWHYSGVLTHGSEATLLEIAQQGLEQCQQLEQARQQPSAPAPAGSGAAAPWLTEGGQPETASPTPGGRASADATPWLNAGAGSMPEPAAVQDLADQEPAVAEFAYPAAPTAGSTPTPLVAEIVEEPDQIILAQADPARRDEVAVGLVRAGGMENQPALTAAGSGDPLQFDGQSLSPEELGELSRGLLRVNLS